MVSGNDAAVALAESVGDNIDTFASFMNQKATDLGLTSSHFVTPHGLDQDEHYTTAYELAKIADYALKNSTFSKIVKTSNYTINIDGNPKNLHNTNELLGVLDGVYGVKTGFTNGANRCLVTSCKRGNLDIICVVLGCDTKKDRTLDSVKLINYISANFSVINIDDIINQNFDNWQKNSASLIKVDKCANSNYDFCLNNNQIKFKQIAINNNDLENVYVDINVPENFSAPLYENFIIGNLDVYINGVKYFSVDIVNKNLVRRKNIFNYLHIFFSNYALYFEC